jgi:acyl-CoA thioesterase FadM
MSVYYHKFEVRWSDIDANRHLGNSTYVDYCSQTRMAFLNKNKIGLTQLNRWGVGPVMLHERYSFFKEIYADQTVFVAWKLLQCQKTDHLSVCSQILSSRRNALCNSRSNGRLD